MLEVNDDVIGPQSLSQFVPGYQFAGMF